MNVSEMYRELKMTKDEFFPLVQKLGFDIGERAIKIDDRVAVKIVQAIKEYNRAQHKTSIFGEEEKKETEAAATTGDRVLKIPDKISVKQFAEKANKRVVDMIAILMRNGIMATINETLDYETAAIIAEDMGYTPELSLEEAEIDNPDERAKMISATVDAEEKTALVARPPVVVIMGHVDHGKTTLLDSIRNTRVVDKESGGITQHIGAYQVEKSGKLLTFIDTPGHEAFTTMRSRGARVADIAILVVAADDGIKPQTLEAIHIMQEAQLPFIVAINKIDKPGADVAHVKKELAELNLATEDYGGKTIAAQVSAKSGEGIDALLDTLLLLAEIEKESIVANPAGETVGTIIESHVDKHSGAVATVLVQNGTLAIGDIVLIGNVPGRVRIMKNWSGQEERSAPPSMPVQVLGLKMAPAVGDVLRVVRDKKVLKQGIKSYDSFAFAKTQRKKKDEKGKKSLLLIVRADKLGSLEAIVQALQNIKHEEVNVDTIQKGLGNITENDVALAQTSGAKVYGFHSGITSGAEKYAVGEGVPFKLFTVIYELLDEVKTEMQKLLSKEVSYNKIGLVKLLAVFKKAPTHSIVGGRVDDGVIKQQAAVKILRSGKMIGEGVITQVQKEKKNVAEVSAGSECGVRVDSETEIHEGDMLEAYEKEEKERSL